MFNLKTKIKSLFPRLYLSYAYRKTYNKRLHWHNPQNIDEKIHWLKFYGDTAIWSKLADKYAVREYVAERGYANILVPLYAKWDNAEDIEWDKLPNQFVMKVNNGCGNVLICTDKSTLDCKAWERKLDAEMRRRISVDYAERHYDYIKPCIIAEQLLDSTQQSIPSTSLVDYKLWSFNGKVHSIWICYDRTPKTAKAGVYDLQWHSHPEWLNSTAHYQVSSISVPRPQCLDRMIEIASALSVGLPEVRVDLYEVEGKVYFGELTLTSAGGFNCDYTMDYLNALGDLCVLPINQ